MEKIGLRPNQIERFERLALPYLPVVLRTARYLTRHDSEAEDLAQDAMIKVMRAIDTFKDGTNMKAWLMTIIRRTHIDRVRAGKRRRRDVSLDQAVAVAAADDQPGTFDEQWVESGVEPDKIMNRFEDQTLIDALKTLPEAIRWTLLLTDVEQLDQLTAATIMEVPVGTVKSRVHRGRRMLRDGLYRIAQERGWIANDKR